MRRIIRLLVSLFGTFGALMALAQSPNPLPVQGNLSSIIGSGQQYAGVSIQLQNCPSPASITGYSVIVQQGYQVMANGAGLVNTTVWPNDLINCNGTTGNSQYQLSYTANGAVQGTPKCYQVISTQGTWNLNTQQPITCGQSPPNPQDAQYRNLNLTGLITGPSATFSGTVADQTTISSSAPTIDPRAASYGAACNWNGTSGADDTAAFQAAVTEANTLYLANGAPVNVMVPLSCEIAGTVTIGSGVHLVGPGSVYVPDQTTIPPGTVGANHHPTFELLNADNVAIENVTMNIGTPCPGNDSNCSAILWGTSALDAGAHHNVKFRHLTLNNPDWGLLVSYGQGTGSLVDVGIDDVTVTSPSGSPTNADGIHIGGNVGIATITNSHVYNRNDAGIALTSQTGFTCGAPGPITVENNVVWNNQIGLDDSGCTNSSWIGNRSYQPSLTMPRPAGRVIYYAGVVPVNTIFRDNDLTSATSSTYYTMQIDPFDYLGSGGTDTSLSTPMNLDMSGNSIHPLNSGTKYCTYMRGSNIKFGDNWLDPGCEVDVTYAFVNPYIYYGSNDIIGGNNWLGNGTLNIPSLSAYIQNSEVAPQFVLGTLTTNTSTGVYSPILFGSYSTPGLTENAAVVNNVSETINPLLGGNPATWGQFIFNGGSTSPLNSYPVQAGYQVQLLGTSATSAVNGHGAGGVEMVGGSIAGSISSGQLFSGNVLAQGGSSNCTGTGTTCNSGSVTIQGGAATGIAATTENGGSVSIQGGAATGSGTNVNGAVNIQTTQGNVNLGNSGGTNTVNGSTTINTGAANSLLIVKDVTSPGYNCIGLNGVCDDGNSLGLEGGSASNKALYVRSGNGGTVILTYANGTNDFTSAAFGATGEVLTGHLNQVATGNFAGTCAMGAGTSCTLTLTAAFSSTPICIATQQSATLTGGAVGCTVSGTTVTVTSAVANSETWGVILIGNPN